MVRAGFEGSLCFGGEESNRSKLLLRKDGTVWTEGTAQSWTYGRGDHSADGQYWASYIKN